MKTKLKENPKLIKKILEHFRFHNIVIHDGYIMCGKPNGESTKSVSVKLDDNLTSSSFSLGISGDLFNMIAKTHNISWSEVIATVELVLNEKIVNSTISIFDGILEEIYVPKVYNDKTYEDNILDKYSKQWNVRFVRDYIKPRTQREFEIGYCESENRITIPWRNVEGKIVGVIGRANYNTDLRYFPLIRFSKSNHLYGLWKTKEYITKTKRVYIGEAEKFVLQLWSYGFRNSVAMGCSTINQHQVELLLKLGCEEFILCLDESSDIDTINRNVNIIKDTLFMRDTCKIGVMLDRNNDILPKGSKNAPSDLGKDKWLEMLNYIKFFEIK